MRFYFIVFVGLGFLWVFLITRNTNFYHLASFSVHQVHMIIILIVCFSYAGKELDVMKEKGERAEELEIQMQKLERDNESLQKKVASLGITCEKVCCILFVF